MNRFTKLLQSQAKAIYLVFILIALAGLLAFLNLPSGVYPELSFPRISVIGSAGDSSPQQLVLTLTRPLEEAVTQVYGVRWVRSKTIRGSAELSIEFQEGTDMQHAMQQLQSRVGEIRSTLPTGVNLNIEQVTPATFFPVLTYNVSSDTLTLADLRTIAQYQIRPNLAQVPGVVLVQIQGGDISEVEVQIDPAKLKSYGLSLTQIANALQRSNQELAVGKIDKLYQQNLVVAANQALNPAELAGVVVTTIGPGKPIFLRDLGQISLDHAVPTQIVSVHGKPGLTINIFRQPNSNVVTVGDGVRKALKSLQAKLPPGISILPAYNESGLVVDAIANVRDSIVIGIVLIIIVLYVFLREWRSTVIAALTIPLSSLAAFAVLAVLHQSLNLMSLGGLAVAIGLVIDDAIVVIENIDRQLQKKLKPSAAVAAAMAELAAPVTSSTVTTVAVFLPLGLLSGVAGQFFISLTITLTAAVVFSLLLALTLTPLLAARWLNSFETPKELTIIGRLDAWYGQLLRRVLRKPLWVGLIALFLLVVGVGIFSKLGSSFLPEFDEGSYIFDYLAPPGTSLAETNVLASKLETILAKTPEVVTWTRRTGAENGIFATAPNTGDIQVILKPQSQRHKSVFQIFKEQRQETAQQVPQLFADFHQILQDELNDLSGSSTPIKERIFGQDSSVLRTLTTQVQNRIQNISGLVDVNTTGTVSIPQLDVHVNPMQAGQLGLTPDDVALQVQDALFGNVVTQLPQGDHLVGVRIHFLDSVNYNPQQLAQLPIVGTTGQMLPLSAIATIVPGTAEEEILRENQQRYVEVVADLQGRSLGAVQPEIDKQLKALQLPAGYSLSKGGLSKSQQQAFQQLLLVLGLGILLVYIVLVIQFRSLTQPLAIFTALPLALFGVVLALWLTHTPLNISSFMGIILLVGLVVKNGIILLQYTNSLHSEGMSLEAALVQAGEVRLRPILMTTLCAILGLLPLALGIGAGSGLQQPLAIAVIGGLSLSAIFTLIFVPVVFRVISQFHVPKPRVRIWRH
ncbi:MAG: efflux RND transporter permease subunit [Chroococcidiopsidaceae cyanobacterium CP_BM_RX_35]|nr:efflux RND transporter permease subunit [Chroococcidiopsidaceae cyanobacterium CP_BM_RX_35]